MQYFHEEGQKGLPFLLNDLKPVQMPNMDLEELFRGRRPSRKHSGLMCCCAPPAWSQHTLTTREMACCAAWCLVENNYNVCELGPRGTAKSHIYKEISPNSILISGGHTTVPICL